MCRVPGLPSAPLPAQDTYLPGLHPAQPQPRQENGLIPRGIAWIAQRLRRR